MSLHSKCRTVIALFRAVALIAAFATLFVSSGDYVEAARPTAARSIMLMCLGGGGEWSFDVYSGVDWGTGIIGITCHGGAFGGLYCEIIGVTGETACSTLGKPS